MTPAHVVPPDPKTFKASSIVRFGSVVITAMMKLVGFVPEAEQEFASVSGALG